MSSYKYQAKITDDIDDAREIIKNVGRAIKDGKTYNPLIFLEE